MKHTLLNPFEKYSEKQLIPFGLLFTIIGSFLAHLFNIRFDGVLDLHFAKNVSVLTPFIDNGITISLLFLTLLILGKYINKKTRVVDVFAVVIIARTPYYIVPITNINNFALQATEELIGINPNNLTLSAITVASLFIITVASITAFVWYITLLYNGFKVASNLKTTKHKILFAVAITVAEGLSKYALLLINQNTLL
ncbi:hypothetical protein [Flavobacterium litorale]|uniref:Yip1 domain-containing protein n=1 Tax=Flavobacterium litorale TaxID=2856519 RepID=A0ABX8V3B6_9FLAO|nr:hypothetical protein [Flavobacterium litorale]QYJ67338.1 hypothetical protein K1I41_07105 [Flavobacterium litorale]